MKLLITYSLLVALLTGCESIPFVQTKNERYGTATAPLPQTQSSGQGAVSQPLSEEAAKSQSNKMAMEAVDLLNQGREDEAKNLLKQSILLDKDNRVSKNMLRQIASDPLATLGSKSFRHTVRAGETLSMIAHRFLGDVFNFYILAKYNDIRVPRDVFTGQVIKVPGDPPVEVINKPKPVPPSPAEVEVPVVQVVPVAEPSRAEKTYQTGIQLLRGGRKEDAYETLQQAMKLDPEHKLAQAQGEQIRQDLIQKYSRIATSAFHRQDLASTIKAWDKVLVYDPNNESARLKRQQALDLTQRIKQFPANR